MPSSGTDNRIRFERQATSQELEVWNWLRQNYGRNASESLMTTVVQFYLPRVLESQGKVEEARQARKNSWLYIITLFGVQELAAVFDGFRSLLSSPFQSDSSQMITPMTSQAASQSLSPQSSIQAEENSDAFHQPIDPTQILSEWDGEEDLELDNY